MGLPTDQPEIHDIYDQPASGIERHIVGVSQDDLHIVHNSTNDDIDVPVKVKLPLESISPSVETITNNRTDVLPANTTAQEENGKYYIVKNETTITTKTVSKITKIPV